MGSWDGCCGLSKLPIAGGDAVADFYIGEVGRVAGRGFLCYPNDLWTPLTIQTYGRYDDYGEIIAEPGWHQDYVTQMLRDHVVALEQGDNEYHDIPVNRDSIDWNTAQHAIHEGRLYVKAPDWVQPAAPIGMRVNRMMVHRFVFDALVSWGIDNWRFQADLASVVRQGMATVAALRDHAAATERLFADADLRVLMRRLDRIRLDDNLFSSAFNAGESGDLYAPHHFSHYLAFLQDHLDSPNIETMVTELAKFIIFRARLSEMQFLWSPQTGQHEQPYQTLSHFYRLCDAYAQRKIQQAADAPAEPGDG